MSRCDFKVVLLGDAHVGKTSLVLRYVNNYFDGAMPYQLTIGAVFCSKVITYKGRNYSLGIWDTAGSEQYMAMTDLFYRGAHAAIICYDPCVKPSWQRLLYWLGELRTHEPDCKVYLATMKMDLLKANGENRTVPLEAEDRIAVDLAGHFEVSSKTGQGVDELFQKIGEDCANDVELVTGIERNREQLIALHVQSNNANVDKTSKWYDCRCW